METNLILAAELLKKYGSFTQFYSIRVTPEEVTLQGYHKKELRSRLIEEGYTFSFDEYGYAEYKKDNILICLSKNI